MSEAQSTPAKAPKTKTEVEIVTMSDGREVGFPGKRRLQKEIISVGGVASVRFDLRNGETRTFPVSTSGLLIELACHGAAQKIGDECAGEEDVDDMTVAIDDMIARLHEGKWTAPRAAGDSFSGSSVVIRAICEATKMPLEAVKAFLQRKLDSAEAAGEKLTRRALYDSFRDPASETGRIIERLEREKRSKTALNAGELLKELQSA